MQSHQYKLYTPLIYLRSAVFFLNSVQIELFPMVMFSLFNNLLEQTELISEDVFSILSIRRLVFCAFGFTNGCRSAKVPWLHSGFMHFIFRVVTIRIVFRSEIGRSCISRVRYLTSILYHFYDLMSTNIGKNLFDAYFCYDIM